MSQIQAIDSRLSHAIEAYNLANVKLDRIQRDLERNKRHLGLAKQNLGTAQNRLADRVVSSTHPARTTRRSACSSAPRA